MTDDFITANKIDFVAHDDIPYTGDGVDDIYGWLKAKGMFVATERTEGKFFCFLNINGSKVKFSK